MSLRTSLSVLNWTPPSSTYSLLPSQPQTVNGGLGVLLTKVKVPTEWPPDERSFLDWHTTLRYGTQPYRNGEIFTGGRFLWLSLGRVDHPEKGSHFGRRSDSSDRKGLRPSRLSPRSVGRPFSVSFEPTGTVAPPSSSRGSPVSRPGWRSDTKFQHLSRVNYEFASVWGEGTSPTIEVSLR